MVIFDIWIFFLKIVSGKGASIFNGRGGGVIFQWGEASVLGGEQLMRWTYALMRRFKVFHGVGGMLPSPVHCIFLRLNVMTFYFVLKNEVVKSDYFIFKENSYCAQSCAQN